MVRIWCNSRAIGNVVIALIRPLRGQCCSRGHTSPDSSRGGRDARRPQVLGLRAGARGADLDGAAGPPPGAFAQRRSSGGSPSSRLPSGAAPPDRCGGVMARRSYGSGSLYLRADRNGTETWYGSWLAGRRRVKRALGLKRRVGSREGLTRPQAEAELPADGGAGGRGPRQRAEDHREAAHSTHGRPPRRGVEATIRPTSADSRVCPGPGDLSPMVSQPPPALPYSGEVARRLHK